MEVVLIEHLLCADPYAEAIYKTNSQENLRDRVYTHFVADKTESYSGQRGRFD